MQEIMAYLREFTMMTMVIRLLTAFLCGGVIGMERGRRGRAAGLRTHILVCVGATMTIMTGLFAVYQMNIDSDPLRIGAQVISGIGFLGVGTIMVTGRTHVRGLTTAAGLWATAAIGLAVGVGFYEAALLGTLLCVLTIVFLNKFENLIVGKHRKIELYMEIKDSDLLNSVLDFIENPRYRISVLDVVPPKSGIPNRLGLELITSTNKKLKKHELLHELSEHDGVSYTIEIY